MKMIVGCHGRLNLDSDQIFQIFLGVSSRAQPFFRRSEGSRAQLSLPDPREIPHPAGGNAGLRNDAPE